MAISPCQAAIPDHQTLHHCVSRSCEGHHGMRRPTSTSDAARPRLPERVTQIFKRRSDASFPLCRANSRDSTPMLRGQDRRRAHLASAGSPISGAMSAPPRASATALKSLRERPYLNLQQTICLRWRGRGEALTVLLMMLLPAALMLRSAGCIPEASQATADQLLSSRSACRAGTPDPPPAARPSAPASPRP